MDLGEGRKAWARGVPGVAREERASTQVRTTGAARAQLREAPAAGLVRRLGGHQCVSGSQRITVNISGRAVAGEGGQVTQGQDFRAERAPEV